jgi:cation diffusion facilitator CzcD-associated flavoprotein CzcO
MNRQLDHQVAIIGAGPYGLAAAAHLRAAGIETCIFGEAMEFWEKQMPEGMLVRSGWDASHISDPNRTATVNDYAAAEKLEIPRPIPLDRFVKYGRWFQRRMAPQLDTRRVTKISPIAQGFRLDLEDGETRFVQRVVVAVGIAGFSRRPEQFDGLPKELASHTSEHRSLKGFGGKRVVVVGSGQSAVESAALLHEAGAEVEIVARRSTINWLDQKGQWLKSELNPLRPLLYPPTDVGPPVLNQIVAAPGFFRQLPRGVQDWIAYRSTRPAASGWLLPRTREVTFTMSRVVTSAKVAGDRISIKLDDGTDRCVDHVLLGTGYKVDATRYSFIDPEVIRALRLDNGHPILSAGLESSVQGLHFLGAPAVRSFGPLNRFVAGAKYAATALTRRVKSGKAVELDLPAPVEEEMTAA